MSTVRAEPTHPRLTHHGRGGELFTIHLVNLLLKVFTLGIYHFWGKTRIRRYVWAHHAFDGERLEYTGTGGELFGGFIKAVLLMVAIIIPADLIASVDAGSRVLGLVSGLMITLGFGLLYGAGRYYAWGYLLGRTRWRAIRFGRSGSGFTYATRMIGYWVLTVVTLGLYTPYRRNHLRAYALRHTWFGSARFSYRGRGRDLLGRFVVAWILTIPTLGLAWLWYLAHDYRYALEHTRLDGFRFRADYTAGQFLALMIVNFLLLGITFGLAYPFVVLRTARFIGDHLYVEGAIDYTTIEQTASPARPVGEGILELFGATPI